MQRKNINYNLKFYLRWDDSKILKSEQELQRTDRHRHFIKYCSCQTLHYD